MHVGKNVMMNHEFIESHQIIDRYIMGILSESERDAFAAHFIGCEDCLDQLELSDTFQRELKKTVAAEVGKTGLLAWLMGPLPRNLAYAAVLLIMSGLSLYFYREAGGFRQPISPPVHELHNLRGPSDYKFEFGPQVSWVALLVDTDPEAFSVHWRVLNDLEEVVYEGRGLGGTATTPLILRRNHLQPGRYILVVDCVLGDGQLQNQGRYSFEIIYE